MFSRLFTGRNDMDIEVHFDSLRLIAPDAAYWRSFKGSYREYKAHKVEDFAYPKVDTLEEFRDFLRFVDDTRRGVGLQRSQVPASMFWLVDDVNYLGSGSVRHHLNDYLRVFGGHIGYSIRPEVWGMGLGTVQLGLLLKEAGKLGIQRPLLTCYETNIASQRVMEKNGACRVDRVINRISGKDRPTFIYEVDLERVK